MECVISPPNALLLDKLFSVPVTVKLSVNMEIIYYTSEELRKMTLKGSFFEHYDCKCVRVFSIPKTNFFMSQMRFLRLVLNENVLILEFIFNNTKLIKYLDIIAANSIEIPSSSFYYDINIDFSLFTGTVDIFLRHDRVKVRERTNVWEKEAEAGLVNGCNLMVRIDSKTLKKINWYSKVMGKFSIGVGYEEPINLVFIGDGFIYSFFYAVFTQKL
ncbi:hypothetical protein THOM_2652 [Trachipleistophora hominis]|uniref:Uncharacterized protein n=1 Tax=Trachipleistophora hominis TaxID=72359 RepID=L7JSL1_TRAHO|nr:hypothetical protein THOM_2652 [Trachipleistophora hominis]